MHVDGALQQLPIRVALGLEANHDVSRPSTKRLLTFAIVYKSVRLGIYCDLRNPRQWRRPWGSHYASQLERIEEAERLGLPCVWLSEHHLCDDGYLPQPLTFAAAIAARTRRIRIGTAVLIAPLRPAISIAEEAAIVDILSEGRLELGLGAGYREPEFAAFGVDPRNRLGVLEQRVADIRELWATGAATPAPLQQRVPIWVGAVGVRGARMAGRLGERLLWLDPVLLAPYRRGLEEGGHDPESARMGGLVNVLLADDPEQVAARIAPQLAHQHEAYRRFSRERAGAGRRAAPSAVRVVSPDDALDLIRARTRGVPAADVFLWESVAGMPEDLARRHVELIATRLVPAFEDATVSKPSR